MISDRTILNDDAESVALIDDIIRSALEGVFEDLRRFDWYIREREIVNLFAFGHMVPLFSDHRLDLSMMGVEFPVLQIDASETSRHGAPKDFVIWSEAHTTLWKECTLSCGMDLKQLRGPGKKPFAIVEWKNVSRISNRESANKTRREHVENIKWLQSNLRGGMLTIDYAVLTTWRKTSEISLRCYRVSRDSEGEFLNLPAALSHKTSAG